MLTKHALRHFNDNAAAMARSLGISSAAVSKWGPVVPLESATALEILTGGAVKVEPRRYPKIKQAMERRGARE